ncbi:MAG: hypothetical protein H7X88_02260 [Gloeobacteraceae cyanobacterium ES-bin-316]|nr:hypothetical protein [Ferruginibacter sp.]
MRFLWVIVTLYLGAIGCSSNDNAPDVSGVKVALTTQRFEQEFFNLDSSAFQLELEKLMAKYPSFGENFISTILNTDPKWPADSALNYIKSFMGAYQHVYDSSQKVFKDFSLYEKQVEKSLQYLKYYFPQYPAPKKIITYIGPMDGYGDILDVDAFIIGLHQHLGSGFSMYKSPLVRETYPDYISNRFEPDYIAINCMKNIVSDMYPEKPEDKTLVVQMVEKGKRLYLLQKLVPFAEDYQLIGYTQKQLKESKEREAIIWDLFVQNNLLQSIDNNIIKNYLGESPKTSELGEASPGNIASFCGWQIVREFMEKFSETKLPELMTMDAEIIFQKAKYKP